MKSGQFYRGKIDGIQKHFESKGIAQLLPTEKLCILADCTEIGEYPRFFKNERVLAKTVVTAAQNTDGRSGGTVNHTVLYQMDATVNHDSAKYLFDVEEFIAEYLADKRRFKMPPAPVYPSGVDSGLIDPPPPIEWEAQQ
jgi:hypothetical protein